MADAPDFTKLVPGFEFMQSLVKNAGAALPGIGQWVAPTLDPEEIDKRIGELRTVQFWLEQNVRMIGATIQALEVQRMTLSTLKSMNVQMEGLRDSLHIKAPSMPAAARAPAAAPAPADRPETPDEPAASRPEDAPPPAAAKPGLVDPMQWWSALTQQFTELATTAMKDSGTDAARHIAGTMVKKSLDAASQVFTKGTKAPQAPAPAAAKSKAMPATAAVKKRAATGKKATARR